LPPENATFMMTGNVAGPPVLSPDGQRLAFVAKTADGKQLLWVRPLNSAVAQAMQGSDNAIFPFWSPDSHYVAYFASNKLYKMDASGGPPQVLADAPVPRGGAWGSTGTILFAADTSSALSRVDAAGGTSVFQTTLGAKETSHRWPEFLPDGKHFLYFAHGSTPADDGIFVGALDSKEGKLLLRNNSSAIYGAPGYLLFIRDGTLVAQRFNLRSLELEGDVRPLADHVAINGDTWRSILTASANGELIYQHGAAGGGTQLVWYDAAGKRGEPLLPEAGDYLAPTLSPDASKLAYEFETNGLADIWVLDLARHTRTRLTFGPQYSAYPVWWPDGKSVVYCYGRSGSGETIFRQNADGTGGKETLLNTPGIYDLPYSVSADGRYLAYMRIDRQEKNNLANSLDIWVLPMFGDRKPFPVVATNFLDVTPVFSPDGKFLAYANDETGAMQVYIQPFPSGTGRWQVSTAGGVRPFWRSDGKELIFLNPGEQEVMAVDVSESGDSVVLGAPHGLFKAAMVGAQDGPFTVSGDGKRFVINSLSTQAMSEPLTLVTNWTATLK
jgi:Tol biopolymer transport system component